jgi:hypothetical protein
MRVVVVKFGKTAREYEYNTELSLIKDGVYDITVDGKLTYSTPVIVVGYRKKAQFNGQLRTITAAWCISVPKRPDDGIDKVIFNEAKRTTAVIWKDGVKTVVKCDPRDAWNKETALALCYMKRAHMNRGAFNETLKRYCY